MSFIIPESPIETAKKAAAHPKVSIMVDKAIMSLAEPKGSSLRAIKKYIGANYNVDAEKLSVFIKKYLNAAVERGDLIQPKAKGITGSFKINQKKEAKPKVTKQKLQKPSKMLISTPKKTLKRKKPAAKSPNESPVKKIGKAYAQVDPAANTTLTKPKAERSKKLKVSLPTKPRKSLVSVPKKVKKARELSKQPQLRQEKNSISPMKPKKKDATKSGKPKKSLKTGKSAPSILKKAPAKKAATKERK